MITFTGATPRTQAHGPKAGPSHGSRGTGKAHDPNNSPTFLRSLNELGVDPKQVQNGAQTSGTTPAAASARQNIVSGPTESRRTPAITNRTADQGSIAAPKPDVPVIEPGATMTVEQARAILATGIGDVVTANKVYYGQQKGPQNIAVNSRPINGEGVYTGSKYVPGVSPTPVINADGTHDWSSYVGAITDPHYKQELVNQLEYDYNYQTHPHPFDYAVDVLGFDPYKLNMVLRPQYSVHAPTLTDTGGTTMFTSNGVPVAPGIDFPGATAQNPLTVAKQVGVPMPPGPNT